MQWIMRRVKKRQDGGKGPRNEEVERYWIGVESSEERTGSEDCRDTRQALKTRRIARGLVRRIVGPGET